MGAKKASLPSKILFKTLKFFAKIKYRNMEIVGIEKIQKPGTIIVANHAQLNGPIIAELFMPENCYIWANGQMTDFKEVPSYAMEDFFPYKKGWRRIFFKIASYLMAPILPCIMKNARAIPVYHDIRLAATIKNTVKKLSLGNNILIFPEKHEKQNNIVNQFREHFVDVARIYHKRTGKSLRFVPMYIAPKLDVCLFGDEIVFNPNEEIAIERHKICQHLTEEITRIGRKMPNHTVIPFDNISRKDYISNKDVNQVPG